MASEVSLDVKMADADSPRSVTEAGEQESRKRERVRKCMDAAKLKHRSSLTLQDWHRYGFAKSFREYREPVIALVTEVRRCYEDRLAGPRLPLVSKGIPRIHCKDLPVDQFKRDFERPYKPVVISGLTDTWAAQTKWLVNELKEGPYRESLMKCGEDDKGKSLRVKLKTFLRYMRYNTDDSPLYIFDASFDDSRYSRGLLGDYCVPQYFTDDLFKLVGEKRRPPYRWFLVGPERSGTSLHVDPLGTSAWNTVIQGRKLWVLFQPNAPKDLVKGTALRQKGEDSEAITYFFKILPRIREQEARRAGGPQLGMIEFIQYPGETVFVPGGWWHAVLNLDDTIAVTQNFCSQVNFPRVWLKTRKSRKHMAKRLMTALETTYPDTYQLAKELNTADNFEFVFSEKKKRSDKEANTGDKIPIERDSSDSDSSTSDSSTSSSSSDSSSDSDSDDAQMM